MTGWYPCVKAALLQRGWYHNPDSTSPYYDLKWTLRSSDISETLQPWQLTNHYSKNVALTTKIGLLKSLQQLVWLDNISATDIIPRGYDLSNPQEIQEYLDDFRVQEVECILKRLYYEVTGIEKLDVKEKEEAVEVTSSSSSQQQQGQGEGEGEIESQQQEKEQQVQVQQQQQEEEGQQGQGSQLQSKSCEEIISEESDELRYRIGPVPSPLVDLNQILINEAIFSALCSVLSRYQRPYYQHDHLDQELQPEDQYVISPLEWELIESYDLFKTHVLPELPPEPIDEFLQDRKDSIEMATSMTTKQRQTQQLQNRQRRENQRLTQQLRSKYSNDIKKLRCMTSEDLALVHLLLCRCRLIHSTQNNLNGKGATGKNMWIVKPAAKSRGRGITTFNNLRKLLNYVELGRCHGSGNTSGGAAGSSTSGGTGGGVSTSHHHRGMGINTSSHWIVQKYMENSLIIANRKFDLRQWVLVVDWNPLVIYFYDECYCRFSVEEYSTSDDGMENSFIHLVNNSIGKNNENFHRVISAENEVKIEGYMWGYEDFTNYIRFRHNINTATNTPNNINTGSPTGVGSSDSIGENPSEILSEAAGVGAGTSGAGDDASKTTGSDPGSEIINKIRRRMKDIAIWALMSGADSIEHRKNSWELYGFDYMIDDEYVPWLIEINSSPACDYSTKVTERYVQKALVELLKVVLDVREWEGKNKRAKENIPCPETGGWEKIYHGPFLETPSSSFGTDMSIKGEPIKLPKRRIFEENSGSPPRLPTQQQQHGSGHGPMAKGYFQQSKKVEMQLAPAAANPFPTTTTSSSSAVPAMSLRNQGDKKMRFPSKSQQQVSGGGGSSGVSHRESDGSGESEGEGDVLDDSSESDGEGDNGGTAGKEGKAKIKKAGSTAPQQQQQQQQFNSHLKARRGHGGGGAVNLPAGVAVTSIPIKTFSMDL